MYDTASDQTVVLACVRSRRIIVQGTSRGAPRSGSRRCQGASRLGMDRDSSPRSGSRTWIAASLSLACGAARVAPDAMHRQAPSDENTACGICGAWWDEGVCCVSLAAMAASADYPDDPCSCPCLSPCPCPCRASTAPFASDCLGHGGSLAVTCPSGEARACQSYSDVS